MSDALLMVRPPSSNVRSYQKRTSSCQHASDSNWSAPALLWLSLRPIFSCSKQPFRPPASDIRCFIRLCHQPRPPQAEFVPLFAAGAENKNYLPLSFERGLATCTHGMFAFAGRSTDERQRSADKSGSSQSHALSRAASCGLTSYRIRVRVAPPGSSTLSITLISVVQDRGLMSKT